MSDFKSVKKDCNYIYKKKKLNNAIILIEFSVHNSKNICMLDFTCHAFSILL